MHDQPAYSRMAWSALIPIPALIAGLAFPNAVAQSSRSEVPAAYTARVANISKVGLTGHFEGTNHHGKPSSWILPAA